MKEGSAKLMWPFSSMEYRAWENKSVEEIRESLRAKADSKETKIKRMETMIMSNDMATATGDSGGAA